MNLCFYICTRFMFLLYYMEKWIFGTPLWGSKTIMRKYNKDNGERDQC